MQQEPPLRVGWGAFGLRILGYSIWLVASQAAGGAATSPGLPVWARAAAAVLVAGPAVIWVWSLQRGQGRADEFHEQLIRAALHSGAVWGLLFGPTVLALTAFGAAVGTRPDPLELVAFKILCSQAPAAALIAEMNAQMARWRFSRTAAQ